MKTKRLVSIFLIVCTLVSLCSINVSAKYYTSTPVHRGVYLIQHVGSGKYLDITDESQENGARLQIWQRYPKHQNQVFNFIQVGNYWKIVCKHSQKVVEVRNSSQSNDAHVSQWDYAGIACQQWSIISNSDGTVSFKNRNSGKYLDVTGNGTANGTKVVQYTSNGTTAQKFRLYRLDTSDVLNATWTRNLTNSNISWSKINYNSYVANFTSFTKSGYYPTPGMTYLKKVEYFDADTVHNMLVKKGLNRSTLAEIAELLANGTSEELASKWLSDKGYNIPGIGIAVGVLETLVTAESDADWNNFANATRSGKGIKKTTYVKIVKKFSSYSSSNNGRTKFEKKYHVEEVQSYTYSVWDGNGNLYSPSGYSGYWNYTFK